MRLTVEERVFILKKSAIAKMIKKFRETGSLLDKNRNWRRTW
jgi:hypothetical protein